MLKQTKSISIQNFRIKLNIDNKYNIAKLVRADEKP
jgi:hypothetical protein